MANLDMALQLFLNNKKHLQDLHNEFVKVANQYHTLKSNHSRAENNYYQSRKDLLNALIESGELPIIPANIDMINDEKGE